MFLLRFFRFLSCVFGVSKDSSFYCFSVQMLFENESGDGFRNKPVDAFPFSNTAAHLRAADGNELGVDDRNVWWQGAYVDVEVLSRVDHDAMVAQDVVGMVPFGE